MAGEGDNPQGGQQGGGEGNGKQGEPAGSGGGGDNPQVADRGDGQQGAEDRRFTQADVDRVVDARLARQRQQHADDTRELRKTAGDFERLRKEHESEQEKAVREAREAGETTARTALASRLVLAELRAAAGGRIDPDRFAGLTEDLDLSRYLDDKGDVDMDRVKRKVDAWSPPPKKDDEAEGGAEQRPGQQRRPKPDPTQRSARPQESARAEGEAEARRRFGDRARVSK